MLLPPTRRRKELGRIWCVSRRRSRWRPIASAATESRELDGRKCALPSLQSDSYPPVAARTDVEEGAGTRNARLPFRHPLHWPEICTSAVPNWLPPRLHGVCESPPGPKRFHSPRTVRNAGLHLVVVVIENFSRLRQSASTGDSGTGSVDKLTSPDIQRCRLSLPRDARRLWLSS